MRMQEVEDALASGDAMATGAVVDAIGRADGAAHSRSPQNDPRRRQAHKG